MQPGAWHEGLQPTRNTYEVPPGPHRDMPAPIDVHVRIVFERDGQQWFTARALEWTSELVRVAFRDCGRPAVAEIELAAAGCPGLGYGVVSCWRRMKSAMPGTV